MANSLTLICGGMIFKLKSSVRMHEFYDSIDIIGSIIFITISK
jgi:hypothetical protein